MIDDRPSDCAYQSGSLLLRAQVIVIILPRYGSCTPTRRLYERAKCSPLVEVQVEV